jgi:hypothetical protein
MIRKYRKKPVVIEALQWRGSPDNLALREFVGEALYFDGLAENPFIGTLEGDHLVSPGDFVIKGVQGEFYPCKPDIFEQTYEEEA